jgi:glutathione transport system substrate-binding protein
MKERSIQNTIAILLTVFLIFAFAACGGGSESNSGTAGEGSSENDAPADGGALVEGESIAASATGYSEKTQSEISKDAISSKDTLTFAAVADPGAMLLFNLFDMTQYPFATACFQYFIRYDYTNGKFYSPISTYEVDEDNMGVTFHINPGIKMHNGDELSASDIIDSLIADKKHGPAPMQFDFVDLDNTEVVDERTLHMKFNRVNGVWESSFSMFTIISGKAYNEANGDTSFFQAPVSSAPYMVTEWAPGDHITVSAFEDYFGGPPPIKKMTMKIVSDETAAFMMLQNGDVDLVWNISADQAKGIFSNTDDSLELLLTDSNIVNYLGMNSGSEALSDFRVRQAIYYAVNRDDIIVGAFDGLAYPINNMMTNQSIGYNTEYDTNSPFPTPDIEKAKELLKEAGYENGLTLRILAESTINFQLVTEQLAAMLAEVGITLKPELTDYATQNAILYGNDLGAYDLYLSFSQVAGESVETLDNPTLFGKTHPEKSADGSGAEWQAMWTELRATPEIEKRADMYKNIQKYFFEKGLYWLPLNETQNYVGVTPGLTGMRFDGSLIYFDQAYFK